MNRRRFQPIQNGRPRRFCNRLLRLRLSLAVQIQLHIQLNEPRSFRGQLLLLREWLTDLGLCRCLLVIEVFKLLLNAAQTLRHFIQRVLDADKVASGMPYMMHLTGKDEATLAKELAGVIFVEPFRKQEDGSPIYLMADEYLSGNVREKLRIAHVATDQDPAFRINVEALEQVQPKDLTASEITVRLGVTWIGSEIIKQFADELFQSTYREQKIAVRYNEYLNNWYISNKSQGNDNIRVTNTYGTKRINGYHLLENALNLRATKIYDTIYDENGKEQHKLNGPATEEAQAKQRMIEDAFKDWIFKDRERRESLVALYNEKFNCIRPREYDGSHIQFFGMNPEIALRPHQRNAIAHILYGHNTLLAHTVGAGKTYEMVAAAMEKKRLGLCSKTLVAVPNHLTGQFASEALKLYPNANILVTTQRDFEKSSRKRFCAKIATGNYDIVVIGHSQFEKIPLSDARKAEFIRKQIDELEMQLESMDNSDSRLTVKQLESKKKQLKTKLSNLLDAPKRDDVVTFEELGADSLMVDEAHNFKNLMTVTKMHNIAGISTTESQKASDLFMKCQYLDEITGARGVTFATGTPISNSMTELYTIWGGLTQLSLGMQELPPVALSAEAPSLLDSCRTIYTDAQMQIIENYPDSTAAKILIGSAQTLLEGTDAYASARGYYTYIYQPGRAGWQTVAVIGPEISDDEPNPKPIVQEIYANWEAPAQTASGSFDFDYGIITNKVQLKTTEKVDGATIEIEPITKSGTIDGGTWNISPADKQSVTTAGHTNDDNFQNNGGAASASWTLHYSVSKTTDSRNGRVGPYTTQDEADAAADSARDAAIAELQGEAQRMVDNAVASAKAELANVKFRYEEVGVPYGFEMYWGSNGSNQTISVPANSNNAYLMKNDELSLQVNIKKTDSETGNQIAADAQYEIFQWDTVTGKYQPTGGYNTYSVQRQGDGTYAVINSAAYATTDSMRHTLYYTQRNAGKFIIVESKAPTGYFGDWTDINHPGIVNTPLGKRGYYIEITEDSDNSVCHCGAHGV